MLIIWKGRVTDVMTEEVVCFNLCDEFQLPVDKLSLLAI